VTEKKAPRVNMNDVTEGFARQPSAEWGTVAAALEASDIAATWSELFQKGRSGEDMTSAFAQFTLTDSSPQSFLQAVAPALTPASIYPRVYPRPGRKGVTKKENERAQTWTGVLRWTYRRGKAERLVARAVQEAAAFGAAYLYVYADGLEKSRWKGGKPDDEPMFRSSPRFEMLRHDQVAWEPDVHLEEASWVAIKRAVTPAQAVEKGIPHDGGPDEKRVVFYEVWDREAREILWLSERKRQDDDGPRETVVIMRRPMPSAYHGREPLVPFLLGETPTGVYPLGLIYHWLPKLWELTRLKALLMINANLVALQPSFMVNDALSDNDRELMVKLFGSPIILVRGEFFQDGKPKIEPLNPKQLSESFYRYIESVKEDIQRESHMSDIMMAKQLRPGISRDEVQALMAAQTQWLSALQESVRASLRELGEVVLAVWSALLTVGRMEAMAELAGGDNREVMLSEADAYAGAKIELDIPLTDLETPEERMKRAQMILDLSGTWAGKYVDEPEAAHEVLKLIGMGALYKAPAVEKRPAEAAGEPPRSPFPPSPPSPEAAGAPTGAPMPPGGEGPPPEAAALMQRLVELGAEPAMAAQAAAELTAADPQAAAEMARGSNEEIIAALSEAGVLDALFPEAAEVTA